LPQPQASGIASAIIAASTAEHRRADNIARNQYHHPTDTLGFFGLTQDMTVHIELCFTSAPYTVDEILEN
jgi:predicted methyltransferase